MFVNLQIIIFDTITSMNASVDLPILSFENQQTWEQWLSHNYSTPGIWLRFYKKASKIETITYAQALEIALCYGWIDGQAKKYDEDSYLQRFTPRRKKSVWSKINTKHVERLIKEKRMKPSGLKAVDEAKEDGRWDQAYDSPSTMTLPEDFLKELLCNKKAYEFYQTLSKANTFAIAYRLQTAKKPETVEKRKKQILEMLEKGEKFH